MEAVTYRKVEEVQQLLSKGADPNFFDEGFDKSLDISAQPTTPLRVIVFCISDSMLDENELEKFIPITTMLLEAGADPNPAKELSKKRYGDFPDEPNDSAFYRILSMIFNWH